MNGAVPAVPPDPPAADRDELARVLLNAPPHPQWSPTADLAAMIADYLIASGVLVDAADIRTRTLEDAAEELRAKAVLRFEQRGPDDRRGAAIWDCAAWLARGVLR